MKISDIIENFIIDVLGESDSACISRNELASYFRCAPSQINYVLQTRFTVDRGFQIESQRGGGGFIRILRLEISDEPYLNGLLDTLREPVSYTRAQQIIDCFVQNGLLTEGEARLLVSTTSERALATPTNQADLIRANILRETVIHLLKR